MGITTAVFTLVGGVMSLTGGEMMSVDIRLPFYVVIAAALLGAVSIVVTWNTPEIRRRTQMLVRPAGSTASD
jgi:Na+-translocating ferredoxin:NAD+ oxidoreductase RnfE subunit